ncbi:MAG: hypothetical protein OHK0046_30440 [Anaerolineae bacterium]
MSDGYDDELAALLKAIVNRSAAPPPAPLPESDSRPPEDVMQSLVVSKPASSVENVPWSVQKIIAGETELLETELARRFPEMAVMPSIKIRTLDDNKRLTVASMSTADNAAQAVFDADRQTGDVVMSFTLGSMLTLRFSLHDITPSSHERWVKLMRREKGGLAVLQGPGRYESDYMIAVVHKYYTNLYCFSPNNFEAGIRMTDDVSRKLVDWLAQVWEEAARNQDQEPPRLVTW